MSNMMMMEMEMEMEMGMGISHAAVKGDLTIFSYRSQQEHLLKKTEFSENIIHLAANYKQIQFIKAALNHFHTTTCESLICDQDDDKNTPFHIAAKVGDESVIQYLYEFFSKQCADDQVKPWRMVNKDGNTPAHVALCYGHVSAAMYLVDRDGDYVARLLNRSKKTLLHLAMQLHVFGNSEFQLPETEGPSSRKKAYRPTEDLRPIIEQLLKTESSVTCWADMNGATPLHQATSLERAYCIEVIKDMLASCPKAAGIHDERSGDTVLHLLTKHQVASYEQGIKLINIPQLYAVRNSKNHQGDTPLHLAARNRDTIMVRVLSRYSPKFGLTNNSGISAGTLVRQLDEMKLTETPVGEIRRLTKEESRAANYGNVALLNERMVSLGMNFLVSRTSKGDNLIHILMQCNFSLLQDTVNGVEEFIGRSIQRLPLLICQKNCDGDTPIHVLAKNAADSVRLRLLELSCEYFEKAQEDARDKLSISPWRLKNLKGDTPLHVAARILNLKFFIKLLKLDEELAGYTNNRMETPLHLLAYHPVICFDYTIDPIGGLIMCLLNVNGDLAYMQDEDGLTPILTAVRERNLVMIKILNQQFPDCLRIKDYKGRTVWHWFVFQRLERNLLSAHDFDQMADICNVLIRQEDISRLIGKGDSDGNTPLHLAIANRRFGFAQFFLDKRQYDEFLSVENKEGVSCYNLIGAADHLPPEFVKSLFNNGNLLFGQRSMYGIPTTKMEAYTNTIGVIAALLATITFTAAFTVPGGLDSTHGTPLLFGKPMFQVFITANVVAMCSSMMVLFCLLWIMTTGNKKESILLLDVSVFLLQISFQATFVTFMSGLYVTTITTLPALAISTCVACTVLIILMHKRLVFLTVVPFFGMLIILGHLLGRFATYLLSPARSLYKKLIRWLRYKMDWY